MLQETAFVEGRASMNPITIQDLDQFSWYGNLKTKNNTVCFIKADIDKDKEAYRFNLMQYRNGTPVQMTYNNQMHDYFFEDDQTILYFLPDGDKDGKESLLYRFSLKGGEPALIGHVPYGGVSVVDKLDTAHLLVKATVITNEKTETLAKDYEVLDELPFCLNNVGYINKTRSHLFVWDLEKETLSDTLTPDLQVSQAVVDGDLVYFAAQKEKRVFKQPEGLFTVNWKTGEINCLIEEDRLTIFSLDLVKDQLLIFATENKRYGLNENPQLYGMKKEGGAIELLMDWDEAIGNSVGTDMAVVGGNFTTVWNDGLYFTSTIVDHNNLYCWKDGTLVQVLEWKGTIHSFGIADDLLWFVGARPNECQQLYTLNRMHDVTCHSDFNTFLKDRFISEARPVFYEGSLGTSQMGWVLYPKDFDPQKSYPGILDIHGGPKTVYGTVFYHEMQVWASKGYFVFFCNPYGSDGQGNAYSWMRGKYGTLDFQDLMTFTDAVLAEIPQIDRDRLGVTGGSYGGFMTNWIIGHTDRFKAAASQRSISNWISMYGTSDIGEDFVRDQMGAGLDQPDVLWQFSPLKYVKNVVTPTLFIHSDEDYRCPLEQGLQMLSGILDQDKPAKMVMFHKENHELSRSGKPDHRKHRLEEITRWMDTYLSQPEQE